MSAKIRKEKLESYISKHKNCKFKKFYVKIQDYESKQIENMINGVFGHIREERMNIYKRCQDLNKKVQMRKTKSTEQKIDNLIEQLESLSKFVKITKLTFKYLISSKDEVQKNDDSSRLQSILRSNIKKSSLNSIVSSISILKLSIREKSKKRVNNSEFCRKTEKFWVHYDNLSCLKSKLVKYLPCFVFSRDCKEEMDKSEEKVPQNNKADSMVEKISSITSVYFDSPSYKTYTTRLYKLQASECIRIRWYDDNDKIVFVERKLHMDGWTGHQSKKLRFKLAEKYVNRFMSGEDVWKKVVKANPMPKKERSLKKKKKDLNDEEVKHWSSIFTLYSEIQESIINDKLRPSVRTHYKRSAFQLPEKNDIRFSLDEDLCMIQERCCENECSNCCKDNWRRKDLEYPYRNVNPKEIVRFPYCILELKTTKELSDEEKVESVRKNIGPITEHVHKFSKFLHATAVLYQMSVIPYWIQQMGTGIRKEKYYTGKGYHIFEGKKLTFIKDGKYYDTKREGVEKIIENRLDSVIRNNSNQNTTTDSVSINNNQNKKKYNQDTILTEKTNLIRNKTFPSNKTSQSDISSPVNDTLQTINETVSERNKYKIENNSNSMKNSNSIEGKEQGESINLGFRDTKYSENEPPSSADDQCCYCEAELRSNEQKKVGLYGQPLVECVEGGRETEQSAFDFRGEDKVIVLEGQKKSSQKNKNHGKTTEPKSNEKKHKKKRSSEKIGTPSDTTLGRTDSTANTESSSTTILSSQSTKSVNLNNIKRIAIPIRVEPKVFFANERTFLSWLHFSIFIGGLGSALVGLGDTKAVISGSIFIIVSTVFAMYALYLYMWRARRIRERDPGPYDDLIGPAILVFVFVFAMALSLLFKIRLH